MGFTKKDIDSFSEFAVEQLSNGTTETTLEECLRQWRNELEAAATVEAVQRGEKDIAAGRYKTLDEIDAEFRNRFGSAHQNQGS